MTNTVAVGVVVQHLAYLVEVEDGLVVRAGFSGQRSAHEEEAA